MNLLGRLPLPKFLQRLRAHGFGGHQFLPDMVDIKANIKAYKKSPEGNPSRKDWEYPGSANQGHSGYPRGGVQAPGGNYYRGGKRGQVLVISSIIRSREEGFDSTFSEFPSHTSGGILEKRTLGTKYHFVSIQPGTRMFTKSL